jgi:hypothetical protein
MLHTRGLVAAEQREQPRQLRGLVDSQAGDDHQRAQHGDDDEESAPE